MVSTATSRNTQIEHTKRYKGFCFTSRLCRTAEEVRVAGGKITREPAPMPGIGTKVTKVQDPDGWTLAFVDNADFLQELCSAGTLEGPTCSS